MISLENLTEANLEAASQSIELKDVAVLERMFHAFILLERLTETGIDFIFKGGTSVLLHIPEPKRLSVDIDIVCNENAQIFESALDSIVCTAPFLRYEKQNRGAYRQPKRRHYKFFYSPKYGAKNREFYVLLDVVEEQCPVLNIENKTIMLPFMKHTGKESRVKTPVMEALLADKLTAFAPHTIGVPFRRDHTETETQEHQVFKQLFDIGEFPLEKMDLSIVRRNYLSIAVAESRFKGGNFTWEGALLDTIGTAFDIACLDLPRKIFSEKDLLRSGIAKMQGDLINGCKFDFKEAKMISAKTACLAATLMLDTAFPFFKQTDETMETLKKHHFPKEFVILGKLRATNPELYWYWVKINQMLPSWRPTVF